MLRTICYFHPKVKSIVTFQGEVKRYKGKPICSICLNAAYRTMYAQIYLLPKKEENILELTQDKIEQFEEKK